MATLFSPGSLISSEPTRIQAPVSWARARKLARPGSTSSATAFSSTFGFWGSSMVDQLGQHDELGAVAGRAPDQRLEGRDAGRHVALGAVLHAGDAECLGHDGSPWGMNTEL